MRRANEKKLATVRNDGSFDAVWKHYFAADLREVSVGELEKRLNDRARLFDLWPTCKSLLVDAPRQLRDVRSVFSRSCSLLLFIACARRRTSSGP